MSEMKSAGMDCGTATGAGRWAEEGRTAANRELTAMERVTIWRKTCSMVMWVLGVYKEGPKAHAYPVGVRPEAEASGYLEATAQIQT
jgi:hypothetical protein